MGRGGRRGGVQGRDYSQRSDLQVNARPLPIMTGSGQPYGQAKEQADSQRAVPMSAPPGAQLGSAPTAGAPTPPPVAPGSLGAFHRPTERPGEPVTAGAALGAGPGPEVMGGQQPGNDSISAMLAAAAAASGNPALRQLAQRAQMEIR